jgi:hypothetical protein
LNKQKAKTPKNHFLLFSLREKRESPSLKRRVYERNMMLEQTRRLNKTTTNLSSVAAAISPSVTPPPPPHPHLLTSSMSGSFPAPYP